MSPIFVDRYISGQVDLIGVLNESGRGMVVIEILKHLPFASVFIISFGLIALISYITGQCTVGYAIAAATQKEMQENEDPATWNIAFWLILVGFISLALYFTNPESLKPLQIVSILTGFPLCFVIYIICRSFMLQLKIDYPKNHKD